MLDGGDTKAAHVFGEFRGGDGNAVLHLHLRHVEIRAQFEGHRDGAHPVSCATGGHVEHVLDAVDFLLNRVRDGLRNDLGIRAGIHGLNHHRGWRDLRILLDGERAHRDQPDERDQDGEHRREDGALDEEFGEMHE